MFDDGAADCIDPVLFLLRMRNRGPVQHKSAHPIGVDVVHSQVMVRV
jgi:hypothetical protein